MFLHEEQQISRMLGGTRLEERAALVQRSADHCAGERAVLPQAAGGGSRGQHLGFVYFAKIFGFRYCNTFVII